MSQVLLTFYTGSDPSHFNIWLIVESNLAEVLQLAAIIVVG